MNFGFRTLDIPTASTKFNCSFFICSSSNTCILRFGAVGPDAAQRFLRPVCFQNFPDVLLPDALKDKNPLKILRRINGELSFAEIIR